jgi:tetratricopeptide (TPR) repeat protein
MLAKALKSFEQSFRYSDKMLEALFNIARCKVLQGQKEAALDDLEKLVLLDRNYCIKVFDDSDFNEISDDFFELINKLKHGVYVQAKANYDGIIQLIGEIKDIEGVIDKAIKLIPSSFDDEDLPYFDMQDYDESFLTIKQPLEYKLFILTSGKK